MSDDDMGAELAAMVMETLQDHVNDIVFDSTADMDLDCQLCQQAALLGMWDRWVNEDEGDEWLQELKRRAEVEL